MADTADPRVAHTLDIARAAVNSADEFNQRAVSISRDILELLIEFVAAADEAAGWEPTTWFMDDDGAIRLYGEQANLRQLFVRRAHTTETSD